MSDLRVACEHGRYDKHWVSVGRDVESCPGGREVTAIEGIVTATGNNTMPYHGEPGPWGVRDNLW